MTEPVDIEFRINDRELEQSSRRAVDSILGINSAGEQTVKTLRNQVSEQNQLIKQIEQDIKGISGKYEKMAPSRAKDEFGSELKYAKQALDEEKAALKGLETQLDAATEASRRLTSTKRELNDQMSRLKLAGQQDTEEFRNLAEQAGTVEQAIREVNKQTSLLGKSDANFQGWISGVSGIAGAFSAGAGALALFGTESKDLQQVQTRLQALMAVTIGLQQAYNTLNKESAFQTVVVAKAKTLWTAAQTALNAQLGISVGLSKVLMVSGIGLLIAGIAGLILWLQKWRKEQEEINHIQEEFKNIEIDVAKSMADQKVKVSSLVSVANDYSKSLDIRKKAVDQLNKLMPDYNGYIDQEGRLVANSDLALKNYLATLYKVEKAKALIAKSTDLQGRTEARLQEGTKSLTFWEELEVGFLNIFNKDAGSAHGSDIISKNGQQLRDDMSALSKEKTAIESQLKEILSDSTVFDALFPGEDKKTDKTGLDANKLKSDTADRLAAIQEAQQKIKQQEYQNELDLQQQQINQMQEGSEKVQAQSALDYEKRLAEIARQGDEMVKAQQDIERKIWEAQNPKWKEKGSAFTPTTTSVSQLPENQQRYLGDQVFLAGEEFRKKEDDINKELLEKYQTYADQRKAIEEKFNKDIAELQAQRVIAEGKGNAELVEQFDRTIAKATKDKGKALITFDFDVFKESPEYVRAFEDLKATSTDTLTYLAEQLETYKEKASTSLDPTELREFTATLWAIIDELTERNPFSALTETQNRLTQSTRKLAEARKKLKAAEDSRDTEKIAEAQRELNEAMDENAKASNNAQKAQKKVADVIGELYDAIDGVGNALGGTAGEIMNFIADIGRFVSTVAEGITKTGETVSKTVAMIEKASAILFIIQLAIQLISRLQGFIKSSHQQYLDYSKEIAQINALRDAVAEYEIAVTKAKQAQDSWFGDDSLKNLKNEWKLSEQYADAYSKKVNETQAKYVDEKGGGWWNNWGRTVIETTTRFAHGDTLGGIESYNRNKDKYDKETVKAYENLRIETKAKTSGVLGIGGKKQKTEDVRTWAEKNGYGQLFDENNIIDITVAENILKANEEGTIKLVGETKETLEKLVEYQKMYEEYQKQLREYVNSLYMPLVDNFVDALWDWYDNGTDALDSFRAYASDTFRAIVTDMIKTIVLKRVVGTYADDVAALYDQYAQGKLTEEELMAAVTKRTDQLAKDYETALPAVQGIITNIGNGLSDVGIDIQRPASSSSSQQAEKGMFQTMSQDTGTELLGQFTAIRIHTANISAMIAALEKEDKMLTDHLAAIEKNTLNTVNELTEVNSRLKRIETEGIKLK